jgi:hypothetical protein
VDGRGMWKRIVAVSTLHFSSKAQKKLDQRLSSKLQALIASKYRHTLTPYV